MLIEPTFKERQKMAFNLLRDEVVAAHRGGDGLRVNVLCAQALATIDKLTEEKTLQLTVGDLRWVFVFYLYWLLDDQVLITIRQSLKRITPTLVPDQAILSFLDVFCHLIEQPLSGEDKAFELLSRINPHALGSEESLEGLELLLSTIELFYYRSTESKKWKVIVDQWKSNSPLWTHSHLQMLSERLDLQARLISPNDNVPALSISERSICESLSPLAELWLLHLLAERDKLVEKIQILSPKLQTDRYSWRVVSDFWFMNSLLDKEADESRGVWLMRRRSLTANSPLLLFLDRRETVIEQLIGDIYRKNKEGVANERWHAIRLGMLQEQMSLRLWDCGTHREALKAQSEVFLEASRWEDSLPFLALQGLRLGIQSHSLLSPEKDKTTMAAVRSLEFATSNILDALASSALNCYPIQFYTVGSLFEEAAELLPDKWMPRLAAWTITAHQASMNDRLLGWRANPAEFWTNLLPALPHDSPAWGTLFPLIQLLSGNGHFWRGASSNLLITWLVWAPLELAKLITDKILSVASLDWGERSARIRLFTTAEAFRKGLGHYATLKLIQMADSPAEKATLSRHLGSTIDVGSEATLKEGIKSQLRSVIQMAVPPPGTTTFQMGGHAQTWLVNEWNSNDLPIFNELLDAVQSERVLRQELPGLLNAIQAMLAYGPESFSRHALPVLEKLTDDLPTGNITPGEAAGPLSLFHMTGATSGDISERLGWLWYQIYRKLGDDGDNKVLTWVRKNLVLGHTESFPVAIFCCLKISSRQNPTFSDEAFYLSETMLSALSLKSRHDEKSAEIFSEAVRSLGDFFRENQNGDQVSGFNQQDFTNFLGRIERLLLHAASDKNPIVRKRIAALFYRLNQAQLASSAITNSLGKLVNDNRHSVRLEAIGGWESVLSAEPFVQETPLL
jgi:hypothetical protein